MLNKMRFKLQLTMTYHCLHRCLFTAHSIIEQMVCLKVQHASGLLRIDDQMILQIDV